MANAAFQNQVLSDGPVLFYRFNDGHLASLAIDSSGRGTHGMYSTAGTSRLEQVTATDAAVRFTGGRVTVPTTVSLNPALLTIEVLLLWRGANGHQQRIIDKSTSTSGAQALYGLIQ